MLLLIVALGITHSKSSAPAPGAMVRVEIRTVPAGAVIRVNERIRGTSNFQLEERPGTYFIEAALDGYEPATKAVTLSLRDTAPIELTLQPLAQTVRLISDIANVKVLLDNQPTSGLQDGQLTLAPVSPGSHSLKVAGRSSEAAVTFTLEPGAAPAVAGPPSVKNVAALVVASFGNRARVYTNLLVAKAELDGQPAGEVGPEGLALNNLAPGLHELSLGDSQTQLKKVIEISAAPAVTVFFQSDQNAGTLVIVAGEENAEVYVDGNKYQRLTPRHGQLRIPAEPGEHHVRVSKPGFEDAPEQLVQLAKGQEKKAVFKLVPVPAAARLTFAGAVPGAQVYIDQNLAGAIAQDGGFQAVNVSPGDHAIELRKDRLHSKSVHRSFAAGQTVHLAVNEIALTSGIGTLRLTVSPATAQLIATRAGGQPQAIAGNTAELEDGPYTLAASAPGYQDRTEHVQVLAGQTVSVNLVLAREVRPVVPLGMDHWEDPKAWTTDGSWHVRRGGGFVLYQPAPGAGAYTFTLMLASGGSLLHGKNLEWFVHYTDEKNYVLFRLDHDNYRRIQCVNGKRSELAKKPHGLDLREYLMVSLQIEVAPGSLVQKIRQHDQWVVLDTWTEPGLNFAAGRFGLLISGKDEVRLSDFAFYPRQQ